MTLFQEESSISSLADIAKSVGILVTGSSQFAKFKVRYENDRIAFVHDCMPVLAKTLTSYQEEILGYYDSGANRVAIRGPHGLGKTLLASVLVHHTILTARADAKVATTASAWRQLEKYLWPEIHKTSRLLDWSRIGREPYSNAELMVRNIRLDNAEAFAIASDDHTTLEGAHATTMSFIFDEAKTIPAATFDAVEGAFSTEGLSDYYIIVLAISTPGDPSGRFYDIHMQKPGYDDWKVRHVTLEEAIQAKRISKEWADRRKVQWGVDSVVYQNRVLGEFADNTEDGVIPMSWVNRAIERWHDWNDSGAYEPEGIATLGVDVARGGSDETVLALRNASVLTSLLKYQKNPTTVTAGYVKLHGANRQINIEGDAFGSSVYDILREQGMRGMRLITPGAQTTWRDRSGSLRFLNNRAAMWWNMRELLDPRNGHEIALPDDQRLVGDLVAPRWEPNSRGVIQIESKKKLKERLGRSTDAGDACCLAFWKGSAGGGIVF